MNAGMYAHTDEGGEEEKAERERRTLLYLYLLFSQLT